MSQRTLTVRDYARTFLLLLLALAAQGCGKKHRPIFRVGSCFGSITKVNFHDLTDLGRHKTTEHNGMVGTCRGGFIDLGHVRNAADVTRWLATDLEEAIMKGKTEFSFKLTDPSRHFFDITYPDNWRDMPESEKRKIARDIAIDAGAYGAYLGTAWHEIITYLGWKPAMIPVFISALAPEDNYSNLLGAVVGNLALRDTENSYNQAVTIAMRKEFEKLDIQPKEDVKEASKNIYAVWYIGEGYFTARTLRRHLDIGTGDNKVEGWPIPGLCENADSYAYRLPNLDFTKHGFSVEYSIKPTIKKRVALALGEQTERIRPDLHFPKIMDYIRKDVLERFGPLGDTHLIDPNSAGE
ncbi:MAG: DUF4056 domain-containing protein [Sedimentisphaerales bacterium]|nr:DUF4056 domain-containing protein [Sedimentisphaerales bacterium]